MLVTDLLWDCHKAIKSNKIPNIILNNYYVCSVIGINNIFEQVYKLNYILNNMFDVIKEIILFDNTEDERYHSGIFFLLPDGRKLGIAPKRKLTEHEKLVVNIFVDKYGIKDETK